MPGSTQAYREALAARDFDALEPTLAEDVVLLAPAEEGALRGRTVVMWIVRAALGALDDFGLVMAIEDHEVDVARFAAQLPGGTELEIVQFVRTDDRGLVNEITGFARPLNAIALWAEIVEPGKPPG